MKYHLNKKTGTVSKCDAGVRKCPHGEAMHFDTMSAGVQRFEEMMKQHSIPATEGEYEKLVRAFNRRREIVKRFEKETKELEKQDGYLYSDEWFDRIQETKHLHYRTREIEVRMNELATQVAEAESQEGSKSSSASSTYNYHPEITEKNQKAPLTVLSAFTGRGSADIHNEVNTLVQKGMTLTEAYRDIWNRSAIRTDKKIVSIDLETAAPQVPGYGVDMGGRSEIIEIGYVLRTPDGKNTAKETMHGVPELLLKSDGTGAEAVHNISPEMVKGLTPLADDPEVQRRVLDDLNGSVLVAHNATFEKSQLTNGIRGFRSLLESGNIEILDTREVCKWFIPEAPNNTNQAFAESSGIEYENAHRALSDATMTLKALLGNKGVSY